MVASAALEGFGVLDDEVVAGFCVVEVAHGALGYHWGAGVRVDRWFGRDCCALGFIWPCNVEESMLMKFILNLAASSRTPASTGMVVSVENVTGEKAGGRTEDLVWFSEPKV